MKNLLFVLATMLCLTVLVFGYQHWQKRIHFEGKSTAKVTVSEQAEAAVKEEKTNDQLLELTANWPEAARETFQSAIEAQRPFKILITGSPAIGSETAGLAAIVKSRLEKTFDENVEILTKIYDMNSLQFIQEEKYIELADEEADLVLLEPFVLKNNGSVSNDQADEHYTMIIGAIKERKPEAVVILQPANPLSSARFYPVQVDRLKTYGEANQLPYLDHWQKWPEAEDERQQLLHKGNPSYPNENGYKLWADYLIEYFIAQ